MTESKRRDRHYFEQVKRCWAALPETGPDTGALPAEILKSWQRCTALGLEKAQAGQNVAAVMASKSSEGFQTFRIRAGGQDVIFSVIELQCGGALRQSISEERIGTNAASLAYLTRKGVFVNGPEHYAQALHDQYAYAEPIFDANGNLCGICCVISRDYQVTVHMSSLAHILACIGSTVYWMEQDTRTRRSAVVSVLDQVPQGVVYIDRKNVIRNFNRQALEVFGLKNSSEDSVIFSRCMAMIGNVVGEGRQTAVVDYRNNRKKVQITAIPLSDQKYEKLFLLEETRAAPAGTPQQQAQWTFDDIRTVTPRMIRAKESAATAAPYDVPVMLVGASGSGKEMFAQSIHNASSRRNGPFVALNASAIAPNLVESTLFGYERGAFTGASQDGKTGYFEAASGGTLFLDELDSVPFDVQTKLLRVLSSKRARRVGGTEDIPVDVRIISAGRVDVTALIERHAFREDLYYRLSPVKIRIPPLAARWEDIPVLARSFLEKETKALAIPCPELSPEFLRCLCAYDWPGNVRELHNTLRYALVFLEPGQLTLKPDLLPNELLAAEKADSPFSEGGIENESTLKLAGILAVSEYCRHGGSVEKIAENLGVSAATVYNYMTKARRYGLI